mmetsp:Transcript_62466/g.136698  ORF Transcript_62466/g.136698 Transcript_62466/m.136698 type:complete len:214 (-) Transcript_62466:285-926(-)
MTWRSAFWALRARAVEVSSSSMLAQEVPLGLKKAPRLNPPLLSCAPTWLNKITCFSSSAPVKTWRSANLAPSSADSEASEGSGQMTAAVQFFKASSTSSNFILPNSSKPRNRGVSTASSWRRLSTRCATVSSPLTPQTHTLAATPTAAEPLPGTTSESKPGAASLKRCWILSMVWASSRSACRSRSSSISSSRASSSASRAASCSAASLSSCA